MRSRALPPPVRCLPRAVVPETPLPGSPYDLVIWRPALQPTALSSPRRPPGAPPTAGSILERYGPMLTRAVVARLYASAPYKAVIHIHDPIACWPGQDQPPHARPHSHHRKTATLSTRGARRSGLGPSPRRPTTRADRLQHPDPRHAPLALAVRLRRRVPRRRHGRRVAHPHTVNPHRATRCGCRREPARQQRMSL
jgi:hypothetical protein